LTAVTFIDAVGKALLTLMAEHGVELVAVECIRSPQGYSPTWRQSVSSLTGNTSMSVG
jgi:hypothetical protein